MSSCGIKLLNGVAFSKKSGTRVGGKRSGGEVGGYNVILCDESGVDRFSCPLCEYILRDPVQTMRGHLACATCYESAKIGSCVCPLDGEPVEVDHTFFDKGKKQEICKLLCYCKHQSDGCTWVGKVHQVQKHEESCDFCPYLCQFCEELVVTTRLEQHLSSCESWLKNKQCPYPGCPNKVESMDELKEHLHDSEVSHAMKSTTQIMELEDQFLASKEEQDLQIKRNLETIKDLTEQVSKLLQHSQQMEMLYNTRTQELENRIQKLEQQQQQQQQQQQVETTPSVTSVQQCVSELKTSLDNMSLRQQLLENSSFDGHLMWKINKVTERMRKAVAGDVTALHSAPILTSKYGYKLCGRLYLDGDGLGSGTHVSMFIVLMRGEFDQLLEWPFNKQISFRLVNQGNGSDLVESFLADPNSSSSCKPVNEMNVASGVPMLIEKKRLFDDSFVKDDNLFVEISVTDKVSDQ